MKMPALARFLGIMIGTFYREHGVPHNHAVYGEHEISVDVETETACAVVVLTPRSSYLAGLAAGAGRLRSESA